MSQTHLILSFLYFNVLLQVCQHLKKCVSTQHLQSFIYNVHYITTPRKYPKRMHDKYFACIKFQLFFVNLLIKMPLTYTGACMH